MELWLTFEKYHMPQIDFVCRVRCDVNGQKRQRGNTKDMIFPIPVLIEYVTKYFTLNPGDIILTGTPEGVGPVKSGDVIQAGLGDVAQMKFSVTSL